MNKISIKREQSQAGLSFAEREKFRPQVKNKLLLLLALLMTAATGAWAEDGIVCTASDLGKVLCTDGSIVATVSDATAASKTAAAMIAYVDETNKKGLALALADDYGYQTWTDITSHSPAVTGGTWVLASETQWTQMITAMGSDGLRDGFSSIGGTNLENDYYWSSTAGGSGHRRYAFDIKNWYNSNPNSGKAYGRACLVFDIVEAPAAPAGYTVTMKDGVKDADKWTVKVGEGQAQALPIGGLKGDGSETVTLQYNGRLKVKGVKATSDAAQAGPTPITLAAKLAYTGGEIADFTDATADLTTMTWAENEHIAVLYEVGGTKKVADAEITAVDGTTGAATIEFTVEAGTPNNTACTLVYPYSAAKDDHSGVKDAATLLAAQDGTLNANLDVRVGEGTIQTTTPGLTVTTQPAAQFAIFKFTTKSVPAMFGSLGNTNVTKLTVTTGGQDYVITPASATSTLYAALPAVSSQAVSFTATDGSNLYAASKASVSFDAAKYYQSTVKMGKVTEVFENSAPYIDMYQGSHPYYKYLHIGLDQAYAIAKQLSTQNGGATVAVVYDDDGSYSVTYALSSDASATAHTDPYFYLFDMYNYRVFLATLWESAM